MDRICTERGRGAKPAGIRREPRRVVVAREAGSTGAGARRSPPPLARIIDRGAAIAAIETRAWCDDRA